jgi:glycosyltransferase involved in cell wall biosynthesis
MTTRAQGGEPDVICFPFIGDRVGGSHLSALGLIRNLDRRRFTPLIVLQDGRGPLAALLNKEEIPFDVVDLGEGAVLPPSLVARRIASGLRVLRGILPLIRYMKDRNVAIVHTNDGRVHVTWGIAARVARVRHLWHHRADPNAFGLRWFAPVLADEIVAVSNFASPRGVAAARCSVVHSPFDVAKLRAVDRRAARDRMVAELGCPPDSIVLGYVGTLQERKRPLLCVDVIAEIRRRAPSLDVRAVFLGEALNGLDRKVLERAVARSVDDAVHVLGFRYPGEQWIAALDVLLVTAVDEPFGRTLIEAMLLGTSVVATASGGNVEAIEHGKTGLLVPPDDPTAFAEAIIPLLDSPESRARLAETALASALERYGVGKHVAAITEVYARLLAA